MFPVAISLMTSFLCVVLILGVPGEMYTKGTQYWMYMWGSVLGAILSAVFFVPLLHPLHLTCSYEVRETETREFSWCQLCRHCRQSWHHDNYHVTYYSVNSNHDMFYHCFINAYQYSINNIEFKIEFDITSVMSWMLALWSDIPQNL